MKILYQYKVKNHNVKDGHTYGLPDLIIGLLRFLNLTLRDCQNIDQKARTNFTTTIVWLQFYIED